MTILIYDFSSSNVRKVEARVYTTHYQHYDDPEKYELSLYYEQGENEDLFISESQSSFLDDKKTLEVNLTPLFGYFKYIEIDGKKIKGDHTKLIVCTFFSIFLFLLYPLTLTAIDDKRFAYMGELFGRSEPTLTYFTILYMINFAFSVYAVYMLLGLFR